LELRVEKLALPCNSVGDIVNCEHLIAIDIEQALHARQDATQTKAWLTKYLLQQTTRQAAVMRFQGGEERTDALVVWRTPTGHAPLCCKDRGAQETFYPVSAQLLCAKPLRFCKQIPLLGCGLPGTSCRTRWHS
jgi:hypothetical protein